MSCNQACALLLSDDGMIFSWGNDHEKYGVLGQEKKYMTQNLKGIDALIEYTIKEVSLGLMHACAIDSLGSLYTWGTGEFG